MRPRDPLGVAYALLAAWALLVAVVAIGALRATQGELASDVAEDGGGAVMISTAGPLDGDPIAVEIEPGSGADAIAAQLVAAGVLDESVRFRTLLGYSGVGPQLLAGRYEFRPGSPATEVIRQLRLGLTEEVLLVVPEGLRVEEVGELVVASGVASHEQWRAALALARSEPFLRDRPEGASLTGYLFPASYPLRDETTAASLIEAMLAAFGDALSPSVTAEVAASGLTLHEVLTLAAIVEREAVLADEQPVVASVFRNRLDAGIKRDADPTVQFAITQGLDAVPPDGWWKRELTLDDLAFDSPYNTYVTAGLPPGPIASPGLGAILAVLRPAETDFFYFVATGDGTGSHALAETLEEHEANVAQYRAR
jgi:UPF0755 protein